MGEPGASVAAPRRVPLAVRWLAGALLGPAAMLAAAVLAAPWSAFAAELVPLARWAAVGLLLPMIVWRRGAAGWWLTALFLLLLLPALRAAWAGSPAVGG